MVTVSCDGESCPECGAVKSRQNDYRTGRFVYVPALEYISKGGVSTRCNECGGAFCLDCTWPGDAPHFSAFGGEVEQCSLCGKTAEC